MNKKYKVRIFIGGIVLIFIGYFIINNKINNKDNESTNFLSDLNSVNFEKQNTNYNDIEENKKETNYEDKDDAKDNNDTEDNSDEEQPIVQDDNVESLSNYEEEDNSSDQVETIDSIRNEEEIIRDEEYSIVEENIVTTIVIYEKNKEIEYNPTGTVHTADKIIFEYDNFKIGYLEDYFEDLDKITFYVWDMQQGWVKTIGHTGVYIDDTGLSIENRVYGYTSDVDVTEDRMYKIELIIYTHKDRSSEERCNIYSESGEFIASIPVNR